MSSKTNAPLARIDDPSAIRNVVLVGSSGSGKTTLFEHLVRSNVASYRGEKEDLERSSALQLAAFRTGDVVLNLLDAPGHPDFVGELRAALRAADAAVFVVAAGDGIDAATAALWHECTAVGMPRAIVVTKLDDGRTTFDVALADLQSVLGKSVQPGYVPLVTGGQITGNLSLVSQQVHDYSSGSLVTRAADVAELGIIEQYRSELIEGIIEESEDADLMDRYLEGDELKEDELLTDLLTAILHGRFYPVIGVNSLNGIGTEQLLTVIENSFPQPGTHRLRVTTPGGQDIESLSGDPAGPLVAEVIRTTSDQFAGRLSLVRIYNGTLKIDDVVHVSGHRSLFTGAADPAHPDHDDDERVGPLSVPSGIETTSVEVAIAGQLVYVSKLSKAETADTLSPKERPALVEPWNLPEPLLPVAIRAASRNDEDKLPGALARLAVEDTTVRLERTVETDQIVLWTMGQGHVDLLLSRLVQRYGVKVEQEELKVPLRETFISKASAQGRHVKQSGGHGQYAVCQLEAGAALERLRLRVRRQGRGRLRTAPVHPLRREGRTRPGREGRTGGLPARRRPGDARRREVPLGRLVRHGVPDGWLSGPARGGQRQDGHAAGTDRQGRRHGGRGVHGCGHDRRLRTPRPRTRHRLRRRPPRGHQGAHPPERAQPLRDRPPWPRSRLRLVHPVLPRLRADAPEPRRRRHQGAPQLIVNRRTYRSA